MKYMFALLAACTLCVIGAHAVPYASLHIQDTFSSPAFRGVVVFELLPEAAPKTVANFIELAKSGWYNNTEWYRYHPDFVVQGGNMESPSTKTVPLEYKLPNAAWTVGLARAQDPDSGSSEYFINVADNSKGLAPRPGQIGGYAVFAKVIKGKEVVEHVMKNHPIHQSSGMMMFKRPFPRIEYIAIN